MRKCLLVVGFVGYLSTIAFGQTFTSTKAGAWSDPTVWGGSVPTNLNSTLVQVNHSVNIPSPFAATAVGVTIGAAGTLTIDVGGSLSFSGVLTNFSAFPPAASRLLVNGTVIVEQGASISPGTGSGKVVVSGTYQHNYTTSAGTIYSATWNAGSHLSITGYTSNTSPPSGLNQSFRNVDWDCQNSSGTVLLDAAGTSFTTILENFTVTNTNFTGLSLTTNSNLTLNIGGNFTSNDYVALSIGSGNATLNVKGNLSLGLADAIGNYGSGTAAINFNGTATQTLTAANDNSTAVDYTVLNGSTLSIPDGNYLSGTGSLTLQVGSNLLVGDQNGITNTTSSGVIRVSGTRTYGTALTGANLIYNGTTQNLGSEWGGSGSLNGIAVNLELINGAAVTNNNIGSTSLVGVLTLTNGRLNIGNANTLTVQGVFNSTSSGTFGGASNANLSFSGSGAAGTVYFAVGAQTLNNLTIGRSGTITLGSFLTVSGNLNLASGDLDFSNQLLIMDGTFSSSSGVLRCNSVSSLVILGSGAFGLVAFAPGSTIGNLTFNRTGSGTASINSSLTVMNTFALSNGDFTNTSGLQMANGSTLTRGSTAQLLANAPVNLPAGQYYNVTYTGGAVTTGLELPSTSDDMLGNLTISGGPVSLGADINVNGNVSLTSSTFSANGRSIQLATVGGTWTKTSGTFSGGSGTLTIDNTAHNASFSVVASSTPSFTNISIPSGNTFVLPSISTNISGNLANSGTLSPNNGTVIFNGTTVISGSAATSLRNVTITGTLTASASTALNIAGNLANSGTFNHNNGTVGFNGTTTISGSTITNLYNTTLTGTLTAPAQLNIAGNFTNTGGTFNHNSGKVLFNGTVALQSVSGSSLIFNDIDVSNAVGVGINNTSRLNGTLTLVSSGVFDADGAGSGIFIVSSSSQMAGGRIAAMATPTNFSGAVTVERYIHSQSGGDYRYLGIPITNGNVGMLKSSIFVTGNFSDRSTNADNSNINNGGNTNPSVFTWDFTNQVFVGVSGGGGTTAATGMSNTTGYSAYDFNNGSVTASFRGTIGKGGVNITISGSNGNYNLVPNPYPSQIDWDNVTKTNVTNAMYLRVTNNVFSSYVGGIASNPPFGGWTGEIATGQSFWAISNGSGSTLALKEGDKTTNAYQFLRKETVDGYFRIALGTDYGQQDEAIVRFVKGATDDLDNEYDAHKMRNGNHVSPVLGVSEYVNIATYLDTAPGEFAVNTMNLLDAVKIVRLNIYDIKPGHHTITFREMSAFTMGYPVILVDKFLGKEFLATDEGTYEFDVTSDPKSFGDDRFHLRINGIGIVTGDKSSLREMAVYPNPVRDVVYVDLTDDQQAALRSIRMIDALGNNVASSEINREWLQPGRKEINMAARSTGVYVLLVACGDQVLTVKVVKQ